ncbi:MAG: tetratricopeptide repeat protein [Bacteroidota bacterium]|nr:tetratricopeptide repeat protein [Bacteroidota bacterium]
MSIKQFYKIFSVLFFLASVQSFSQAGFTKEQLYKVLSKPQPDTILIDTYTELCWPIYSYDDLDSSIYFGKKAVDLSTKINDTKRLSIAHRRIGITYTNYNEVKKAMFHQQESFVLSEKIGFKKGMQLALNNIGVLYLNNQLYNKALFYFLKSIKIIEETKDYKSASNIYINCGIIYLKIDKIEQAETFFLKANNNAKLQKDISALIVSYTQLSTIYRHKKQPDLAILYLERARTELDNQGNNYLNLDFFIKLNEAIIFSDKNDYKKALEIYINIIAKATNYTDKITVFINIGDVYKKINKIDSSLYYYELAYKQSLQNKMYSDLEYLSHEIAAIHAKKNNLKKYSEFIEYHLNFKDSNDNINKTQNIISQQLEFDYERKQIADSISYANKEQINTAKLEVLNAKYKTDKLIRIALIVFVIIIAFVAFFIYSRLRLTNKQNKIIEQQKLLVEQKQKEILDSINYAKRIQKAILPQEKYIQRKLNEHKKK